MEKRKNCGNCVYWERDWMNRYEGYCAVQVELTDMLFRCSNYGAIEDENHTETAEASVGGMV